MYIPNFNGLAQFQVELWEKGRETNTKNKKNWPKNYIFETVRRHNGSEKSKSTKDTSMVFTDSTYQIYTFLINLDRR